MNQVFFIKNLLGGSKPLKQIGLLDKSLLAADKERINSSQKTLENEFSITVQLLLI